ncbi:Toll-Interleukin-Resistance (TIR) domain family protein [Forsythia ovata]|uniref:Toll-Interleukin-Resistance (TIR) domain family protein n=1 Tax=Forsythia ovata TaxID=205694 RepID=A0ABD1S303_9LAMI
MQRSSTARSNICGQILQSRKQVQTNNNPRPCDVFINHRGIDTKRSVAGLLYNHLRRDLRLRPFLDSKNMKPGDKLFDKIEGAIGQCKIGIAVFSPQYCDSHFCLHELALMMETKKKVIPVFCDVKPSELRVKDYGNCPAKDVDRFQMALEEAKYTVGLAFDTLAGDWSEFLARASDAVIKNLVEVEQERLISRKQKSVPQFHCRTYIKNLNN